MGDNNDNSAIPAELYERYSALREAQLDLQKDLGLVLADTLNLTVNHLVEARALFVRLVEAWAKFKAKDAELRELNLEGLFAEKSYFVNSIFKVTEAMYSSARQKLYGILKDDAVIAADQAAALLSFHSSELNPEENREDFESSRLEGEDRVRALERMVQDLKNQLGAQAGGRNDHPTDLYAGFVKFLQRKDGDANFPEFPKEDSEFRIWRKKLQNWEKGAPNIELEAKIEFLLRSVGRNAKAAGVLRCFDSSIPSNYQKMLKALDEQFFTARQTVFNHFMAIVVPGVGSKKGSEFLQELYNKFTFEWNNFDSFTRELMTPEHRRSELEVLKFQQNVMKCALLFNALDVATRNKLVMQLKLTPDKIPQCDEALEYIKIMFLNAEGGSSTAHQVKVKEPARAVETKKVETKSIELCVCCNAAHKVVKCPKFVGMTPQARYKAIRQKGHCFICLYRRYKDCDCGASSKRKACVDCGGKHHVMLSCFRGKPATTQAKVETRQTVAVPEYFRWDDEVLSHEASVGARKIGLMDSISINPTAVAVCHGVNSERLRKARAHFDTGADEPLVTYAFANELKLRLKPTFVRTFDYQGVETSPVRHEVTFIMRSCVEDFSMEVTALVKEKLGGLRAVPEALKQQVTVSLADTDATLGDRVDIILPARYVARVRRPGMLRISEDLILENTAFGYMAVGGFAKNQKAECNVRMMRTKVDIMQGLTRFFDASPLAESQVRSDEELAEELFLKHFSRREDGRMVVGMPLVQDACLGESKRVCVYRAQRVLKQLTPKLRMEYVAQFEDLMKKGYIRVASSPGKYYVSHLPVIREESLTHALRVVFDSSQKTSNGLSLNDIQLTGKKLQNSLPMVVIGSRIFEKMVTADISKMYLSIDMIDEHIPYQHTFMPTREGKLIDVEMPTVIFGNKSSPFLAIRAMHELASQEGENFPLASGIIRDAMYVDDVLVSLPTEAMAKKATEELGGIASGAKLKFRKWASNSAAAIAVVPEEDRLVAIEKEFRDADETGKAGILGLSWVLGSDKYALKVNKLRQLKDDEPCTLRFALSQIATVYDATGLVSPAFLTGRLILKDIYRELLNNQPLVKRDKRLDVPVPDHLRKRWLGWSADLSAVSDLLVDRWIRHKPGNKLSLLAFADASEEATGTAIYAHSEGPEGVVVTLLMGKSNVRPNSQSGKNWTIPKLELKAMETTVCLAVEIKQAVEKALRRGECEDEVDIFFFSDSEITLAWLQGKPEERTVFVRNRLTSIHKMWPDGKFYKIETEQNPADIASRPCKASELVKNGLWWHAPEFLREKGALLKLEVRKYESILERKGVARIARVRVEKPNDKVLLQVVENLSDWKRTLVRVGWLRRLLLKKQHPRRKDRSLSEREIDEARTAVIKAYQRREFLEEIEKVLNDQGVESGPLSGKRPFIDENGLLRISTRLQNVKSISWEQKNPVVLPKVSVEAMDNEAVCPLTIKLIRHYHQLVGHGGLDKTLAVLNQEYYIPRARQSVKAVLNRCVKCRTQSPKQHQLMGNVPMENVTPSPPFYHVSVDAFGPIQVKHQAKRSTRRTNEGEYSANGKAYGLVFTCRATRGIHLEVALDASAEEFLRCFRNFVATRGLPRSVLTDNQTNFVKGAEICKNLTSKDLLASLRKALSKKASDAECAKLVSRYLGKVSEVASMEEAIAYVESKFIDQKIIFIKGKGDLLKFGVSPCYSPWHNGLAESSVKVVKSHLNKILGACSLTPMELYSVLKRVEAMVNSRPIAVSSAEDGGSPFVITPAHFWAGRPLVALPSGPVGLDSNSMLMSKRASQMDQMVDAFWEVVKAKHFEAMKRRPKWLKERESLKCGQIVLLRDKNTKANCWPKAIVTKLHPGADGVVRVVTVRNALGHEHERGTAEVVALPVCEGKERENSRAKESGMQENKSKAKNPVVAEPGQIRRSSRLASKKRVVPSKVMLGLCLTFSLVSVVLGSVIVPKTSFGGALVFDVGAAYRRSGEIRWEVATKMRPAVDAGNLQAAVMSYGKECNRTKDFANRLCVANLHMLEASLEQAMQTLGNLKVKPARAKRSMDEEGVLLHIWRWLFGEHQPAPSRQAIQHLAHGQELLAEQQKNIVENVNMQLVRLKDAIDEYERIASGTMALAKKLAQMQHTYALIADWIRFVMEKYSRLELSKEDVTRMVAKLNDEQIFVPKFELDFWEKVARARPVVMNGEVLLEVTWPLIQQQAMRMLKVVAAPDEKNSIMEFAPTTLVVDISRKLYATRWSVLWSVETSASVLDIEYLMKFSSQSPCAVAVALDENVSHCPRHIIAGEVDEWTQIHHNFYSFVSNVKKEIVCPPNVQKINEVVGTVHVKPGCWVDTPYKHIIHHEQYAQAARITGYHVPGFQLEEVQNVDINVTTLRPIEIKRVRSVQKEILAETAASVASYEESSNIWIMVLAAAGATCIFIATATVLIIYWLTHRSQMYAPQIAVPPASISTTPAVQPLPTTSMQPPAPAARSLPESPQYYAPIQASNLTARNE